VARCCKGTAFIIVAGGTVGAVMVQMPLPIFLTAMMMIAWVFLPPKLDFKGGGRENRRMGQRRPPRGIAGF